MSWYKNFSSYHKDKPLEEIIVVLGLVFFVTKHSVPRIAISTGDILICVRLLNESYLVALG